MTDTARLSELIKWLVDMLVLCGDVPVYLASDSECNSYGSVDVCGIFSVGGNVIISPYKDGVEVEMHEEEEE